MTAPIKPALKRAFARDIWRWVPAIANTAAPTVAEVTAVTGFNLSCSLFGDTQDGFDASTDKVSLPRRNCETDVFQVNGATTHSAPDLLVSFQPQADAGSDGKKAWEAMDDLSDGFLIRGQDLDPMVDLVAGDFVDVVPASLGVKVPTKTSNGADGVYAFKVPASIIDSPEYNVAVVA
jgi:hypothetical protein